MTHQEIISALGAMMEEAKLAERKINYSSQVDRLEKKVKELEKDLHNLQVILRNKNIL